MGHYRSRRMLRPRPTGEPSIEQLTEELSEARRKIAHYAAIIAYEENEIRMLRSALCPGCKAQYGAVNEPEPEHGDCGYEAGGCPH